MKELINLITENENKLHQIVVASIAQYNLVRIHVFDDCNGRGARILMKYNFFSAIIRTEKKRKYLSALQEADEGEIYTHLLIYDL